jgi:SAM-dependent methyltransferase
MNKPTRWELAQKYEHEWWKNKTQFIKAEYYRHSAEEVRKYFNQFGVIKSSTRILEIGSGAAGILTFLTESSERYAIDPLETYYSSVQEFANMRDKEVKYSADKGEKLPFEKDTFDLLIVDNVLDHCERPELVMSEMKRVLKPEGIIYFRQNAYNLWGKTIREIMELFLIDKGHPFTFTKTDLRKLFDKFNFSALQSKHNGYFETWKRELTSGSMKDLVKALLFVTRDRITLLLKNQ